MKRALRAVPAWFVVVALLAGALAQNATAQTKLPTFVTEDTSLPPGDYVVDAAGLSISLGAKLTFAGGSTIAVPSGASIVVHGQLVAIGASDAKIAFVKNAADPWLGIVVKSTGSLTLEHAAIRGANVGVTSDGPLLVQDAEFTSCVSAAVIHKSALIQIRRTLFLGNAVGTAKGVLQLSGPAANSFVIHSIFHGSATSESNALAIAIDLTTTNVNNQIGQRIYITNNTFARFDASALHLVHGGDGTVVIVNNSFKYFGPLSPAAPVADREVIRVTSLVGEMVVESNNFDVVDQGQFNTTAQKVVQDKGYVNYSIPTTHRSENPQNAADFYRLAAISATIGKGVLTNLPPADTNVDIDGDKRPLRDSYISPTSKAMDLGADEYKLPGPKLNDPKIAPLGQGASRSVTLTGSNLPPDGVVTIGDGSVVTATPHSWSKTESFPITINVPLDATSGSYDLTFRSDEGSVTLKGAVTVVAGPKVTGVTPNTLSRGASKVTLTISGSGFTAAVDVTTTASGVSVDSVQWVDANTVKVVVSVSESAPSGAVALSIVNNDNGGKTSAQIQVNPKPEIASVVPDEVRRGTSPELVISGGSFQTGITAELSGTGLTAGTLQRESDQSLKLGLTIVANATLGQRTLTLTNPDGGNATTSITVVSNPQLSKLTPSLLTPGAQLVTFTVKGSDLLDGASFAFVPAGLTVQATYQNDTTWQLTVTIPDNAIGSYTLEVTNNDGPTAELSDALTIKNGGIDPDASNGDSDAPDTTTPTQDVQNPKDQNDPGTDANDDDSSTNADGADGDTKGKRGSKLFCSSSPDDADPPTNPAWMLLFLGCLVILRRRSRASA
ncbi:MAG: hypothetical protein KC609_06085 [Myxococcales bacterium]|nr:hypothetical protein [Myxococcales bacterium]